ncbi:hypothetical protein [Arthrobacter sp. Soil764]|uniref:hypothetical protein n=1 Tax=Arthrobacter sp. Soil764 TaxID=1736403 RepID=UPI0009E6EF98|nr:hypothetical protein [Arthrobacter sp. Soil764]
MAGTLWGADVEQLRTLAQQFSKTADLLQQQSTQLSSQINNNPAWKGADAQRFRSDWNSNHRTLLQQTVSRLQQESKVLLRNADEQEKASTHALGFDGERVAHGGPADGPATSFVPWGPEWIAEGDSPFRKGWDAYNGVLGIKGAPLGLRDIQQFASTHDEILSSDWRAIWSKELWKSSAAADELRGAFSGTLNLVSGRFGDLAEVARGVGAESLGRSQLRALNAPGNLLGGIGVALDGLDSVNAIREGETGDAVRSGLKTLIGAGSFVPGPIGVSCMVIGGAWAAVELVPGAKDAIDQGFDAFGDFAEDVTSDIGDGVKDFFGF